MQKYMNKKKKNFHIAMYKAKRSKTCYLFLLPYAVIFTLFYIVPVVMSICLSFTYYNVLETPRFVGLSNYIDLFLADDVFLTSVTNTFAIAAITGPLGYLASFLFAWFINELPRYIRAFAVLIFYAPPGLPDLGDYVLGRRIRLCEFIPDETGFYQRADSLADRPEIYDASYPPCYFVDESWYWVPLVCGRSSGC